MPALEVVGTWNIFASILENASRDMLRREDGVGFNPIRSSAKTLRSFAETPLSAATKPGAALPEADKYPAASSAFL